MKWYGCYQLLLLIISLSVIYGKSVNEGKPAPLPDTDWWKKVIVYQIYPKSFKDSDGDGMGDIKGITSKLDYLKDLGVGCLWLNPIFKSPQVDSGYDISDFKDIEPMLGTIDDVKELKKECDARGLKLVMDFVPNHSSSEHEWFLKALQNEQPYVDYYVWSSKKEDGSPPNNWQSIFFGSAWECDVRPDDPNQCYLHQFATAQPDLNYRNPDLLEEMKDVLRFWIEEVGVDGYRMDAVPFLVEDVELRDEVPVDPSDPTNLIHNLTQHLPETYDIAVQFREVLDEFGDKLMMTEAYGTTEQMLGYYGTKENPAAHFTFNFELINNLNPDNLNAYTVHKLVEGWLEIMDWRWSNWVIGNHDQHRVASRLGNPQLVDAWNALVLLLPGTAVTYMGEELGMEDGYVSWEDTDDPQACNGPIDGYEQRSRDPARTPFQWDDSKNAGFSDTDGKTWLPVANTSKLINVQIETEDEKSHLNFYKKLVSLRQVPEVSESELKMLILGNILVFSRTTDDKKGCAVAISFDKNRSYVNLSAAFNLVGEYQIVASSDHSNLNEGDSGVGPLELTPFDVVVISNV